MVELVPGDGRIGSRRSGADHYCEIITGEHIRRSENLTAIKSSLGSTLQGPNLGDNTVNLNEVSSLHITFKETDIKKLWKLETIGTPADSDDSKKFTEKISKAK
ncbi:hypothetical protein TcasGA2_TC005020 [Tribolium castaneum]|uniref:Uncharacterized protein n=1 Tax=Tribolium castaneum TaxID=7070 RepID=D7EJL3_TRICA|nr:hypothetical protein TcasGA2_TC005020 [Tribolium castaneum]